jgi:hypothetical protein
MGVVVNKGIFGGGVYSTAHGRRLRMVGRGERQMAEITIQPLRRGVRTQNGKWKLNSVPPYLPKSVTDQFHPSGNSLCFAIQLAHVMDCNPIYAVGFTLQTGLGYFFGRTNPVTRKTSHYEQDRALEFCRWYEKQFPGRVLLDPSFGGPIREVFSEAKFDAREATPGSSPADVGRHESVEAVRDASEVE